MIQLAEEYVCKAALFDQLHILLAEKVAVMTFTVPLIYKLVKKPIHFAAACNISDNKAAARSKQTKPLGIEC